MNKLVRKLSNVIYHVPVNYIKLNKVSCQLKYAYSYLFGLYAYTAYSVHDRMQIDNFTKVWVDYGNGNKCYCYIRR